LRKRSWSFIARFVSWLLIFLAGIAAELLVTGCGVSTSALRKFLLASFLPFRATGGKLSMLAG
jgi:hypothetical protein